MSYTPWEWPSIIVGQKTKMLRFIFTIFFHFSFFPSLTPVWYIGKFVSKISQELLCRGFWNLVQMLDMTCCIVSKRISMLLLIIPFICPFFFSLQITFFITEFCAPIKPESSNFVYTLREAKFIVGKKTKILWLIYAFFYPFFQLSLQCST